MWPVCEVRLKDIPFCLSAIEEDHLFHFLSGCSAEYSSTSVRPAVWLPGGERAASGCGDIRYYCWLYVASMILLQGYRGSAVPCVGQLRNGGSLSACRRFPLQRLTRIASRMSRTRLKGIPTL